MLGIKTSRISVRWFLDALERLLLVMLKMLVYLGTLLYYRLFQFNTLQPIVRMAKCTSSPDSSEKLLWLIIRWRTRKCAELHSISIACAILAAAVIGSFSWNAVPDAYWLASALWYCSLIFSILGILLSAQQLAVLELLGEPQPYSGLISAQRDIRRYLPLMLTEVGHGRFEAESQNERNGIGVWKPRWKMVFTWQCAIMFMSYSVCFYLIGLTIFVCTPLIRREKWSTDADIAVIYLAVSALAGGVFVFCSFWVYHYVDLDHESGDVIEAGKNPQLLTPEPSSRDYHSRALEHERARLNEKGRTSEL